MLFFWIISLTAVSYASHIDAKRISKIERGVISASYNDMILFSEFFGVTLDYLIIGKRQDVDALKKRVQDAQPVAFSRVFESTLYWIVGCSYLLCRL